MIETEAKSTACFRAATFGASQQLADGPGPNCIGSACMAWRWQWSGLVMAFEPDGSRKFVAPAGEQPHGFCGLGGKP